MNFRETRPSIEYSKVSPMPPDLDVKHEPVEEIPDTEREDSDNNVYIRI